MIALLIPLLSSARAETPSEIVARARTANRVESAIETLRMTLVDKSGSQRALDFEIRSRRTGEVSKAYMKFTSPSDQAGTQFLLIDNPTGADERLVYLPTLKRVTMVTGGTGGRFVGSDFTFEDLAIRDAVTGTHTLVEDTAESWVIDTAMTDGSYTRIRSTIGKADLVLRKVEFFDAKGPIKVLQVVRTEKDGAITLPVETEMSDLRRGTRTKLVILSHQLNVPLEKLPNDTFSSDFLERGG